MAAAPDDAFLGRYGAGEREKEVFQQAASN